MQRESFVTMMVNGLRVHAYPTDRFKTVTLSLMLSQSLQRETVTQTAVLPQLLRRASARFPNTQLLRQHLDEMYGAVFAVDTYKRGENQVIQFFLDVPHDKYLRTQNQSQLRLGLEFLSEVVTRPYLEQGAFAARYLHSAKEAVQKNIQSLIDDKIRYAAERCVAEMCQGEPFGLYTYGVAEDLPGIVGEPLYHYYRQLLRENPIDLFVVGEVDPQEVEKWVGEYFSLDRQQVRPLPPTRVVTRVPEVRRVVEQMNVTQGKLNLGLRTGIVYQDEDYPALMVYNGVLGGFAHSKLFHNVREKASLAYYASSRIESHKGIMTIQSGIEIENFDRALEIILEQLEMMRQGRVEDEELAQTKAVLANQLRQIPDRAAELIQSAFHGVVAGRQRQLDELIGQIQQVTVEDLKRVAGQVVLDTVYFLRDQEQKETGA